MTRFQGIETNNSTASSTSFVITEMTRFQGIETCRRRFVSHAFALQKWPDSRGLKQSIIVTFQVYFQNYRNDPIPGDWNKTHIFMCLFCFITEMTWFQGIETFQKGLLLLKYYLITEMTRFQGIETEVINPPNFLFKITEMTRFQGIETSINHISPPT